MLEEMPFLLDRRSLRVYNKRKNRGIFEMKKLFVALFAAVCLLVLAGCECEHDWTAPDCVNPERCAKCGEYGVAPLGHTWIDPTCEDPAICSVCGKQDAEPLGHQAGQWVETLDVAAMVIHREQPCLRCGEAIDAADEEIPSLVSGEYYLFTPEEFIGMINNIYTQQAIDLRAEMTVAEDGKLVGLVTRDGARFGELVFANYSGAMTKGQEDERTVAQVTIAFAYANLNNGVDAVVNIPEKDIVMDAVKPVIMACLIEYTQEEAVAVVELLYENMGAMEGSVKSADHDQENMTFFITDELLRTVFGVLPSVAWNTNLG